MRLLFLQSGDYAEAWRRLGAGGPETYRDQKWTVDRIDALASGGVEVITLSVSERIHDEVLRPGLRSIGIGRGEAFSRSRMESLLDAARPDRFVARAPNPVALEWAARRGVPTLPVFADMFFRGIREWFRNRGLAQSLRRLCAPCVSNHSLTASRSLRLLGVPASRIVPYEFKPIEAEEPPKARPGAAPFRLLFVGKVVAAKGIGECLEALALLAARKVDARLTVAGGGEIERFRELARGRGVAERVEFLGVVPAEGVRERMRSSDIVIVPSRHDYQEGLPNTVFEALASRTPLITSDHPAFVERLRPGIDAVRFKAGRPAELAARIEQLLADEALYGALSRRSGEALRSLYVGLEWCALLELFLEDPLDRTGWVARHSLERIEAQGR